MNEKHQTTATIIIKIVKKEHENKQQTIIITITKYNNEVTN